jgi:hypothetical protein
MEKIDYASFLELEKQIKEKFTEGDLCIGFRYGGKERGTKEYKFKYPVKIDHNNTITTSNGYYVYSENANCSKFALNLSKGESIELEKDGKLNTVNNNYSII